MRKGVFTGKSSPGVPLPDSGLLISAPFHSHYLAEVKKGEVSPKEQRNLEADLLVEANR